MCFASYIWDRTLATKTKASRTWGTRSIRRRARLKAKSGLFFAGVEFVEFVFELFEFLAGFAEFAFGGEALVVI
jgi:hypothetical protein